MSATASRRSRSYNVGSRPRGCALSSARCGSGAHRVHHHPAGRDGRPAGRPEAGAVVFQAGPGADPVAAGMTGQVSPMLWLHCGRCCQCAQPGGRASKPALRSPPSTAPRWSCSGMTCWLASSARPPRVPGRCCGPSPTCAPHPAAGSARRSGVTPQQAHRGSHVHHRHHKIESPEMGHNSGNLRAVRVGLAQPVAEARFRSRLGYRASGVISS